MAPRIVGGVIGFIALCGMVYCFFIQVPPENRGNQTKSDKRNIYAGVWGVTCIGSAVWAHVKTNRWRILNARGKLAPITDVSLGVYKNLTYAVRVRYLVDGVEYKIARDMHESNAEALAEDSDSARVVYDPQKPASAELMPADIFALPDR